MLFYLFIWLISLAFNREGINQFLLLENPDVEVRELKASGGKMDDVEDGIYTSIGNMICSYLSSLDSIIISLLSLLS
jgi:hypothetical protein